MFTCVASEETVAEFLDPARETETGKRRGWPGMVSILGSAAQKGNW
jgi:hypothetical protein